MTTTLDGMRGTGAAVRAGTDADAVDGLVPAAVAEAASTAEVSAVLRAATERGLTVVPRGAGTRLSWGGLPRALDLVLDVSRMDAVLAHAAGDLVVTAQAGLRTAALQESLAPAGQRLALDTLPGGTLGGTIATATSGPLRYRYGSVRDMLIGITVVRADGTITKSGGTVVKNVAGYDLGKLYTGSLGTLGVITEAVFRLHPLPDAARWVTVTAPDPATAAAAVAAVRESQNDPVAIEVDRPERGGPTTVGIALEGSDAGMAVRAEHVAGLLAAAAGVPAEVAERPLGWWGALPYPVATGPGVTFTHRPSGLAEVLTSAPGALRGSAGTGVLAVGLDPASVAADLDALRVLAGTHGGTAVLRVAAPEVKAGLDLWGPVPALALMRRLKDEFDPDHRLAPGRFVGGI